MQDSAEVHAGHLGLWEGMEGGRPPFKGEGGVGLDRVKGMRKEVMCRALHSKTREKAD